MWTTPPYDFRTRYGDEIADIIAIHSTQSARHAKRISLQDIKAELQALIADPKAVDLQRVDPLTHSMLMDPAWRRMHKQMLPALTLEELVECAKYALDHFPRFKKSVAERTEVTMVLSLLTAARAWHAARRNNL
ncbi:MAG: hypothetical protein ACREBN_06715, partial [Burkholderiaceae bacterium]